MVDCISMKSTRPLRPQLCNLLLIVAPSVLLVVAAALQSSTTLRSSTSTRIGGGRTSLRMTIQNIEEMESEEDQQQQHHCSTKDDHCQSSIVSRRSLFKNSASLAVPLVALSSLSGNPLVAQAEEESSSSSFAASLAEKAAQLSSQVEQQEAEEAKKVSAASTTEKEKDTRTIYDFKVPVAGKDVTLEELVMKGRKGASKERPKAVLVVNIKQDDPIARRNIPELIALGAQFGQNGDLAVVCVPTDQGYYEPDTSALIRLKLASEYGYGINPALQLTDKLNLLGNTADPFMRYIQSVCRTPAGLGRIQGNFEKFLVDGQTGKPLRRYPRKYMPRDISEDIEALVKKNPDDTNFVLPPAGANFKERWREAAVESERDTYRFQKGLNYFDYEYYEKKQ